MPTYYKTLSDDLIPIAMKLQPYLEKTTVTHDVIPIIKSDPQFLRVAFQQVMTDTGVYLTQHEDKLLKEIIKLHGNVHATQIAKQLMEITNGADFYWKMYDDCMMICKQSQMNFSRIDDMEFPNNVADALPYLKVTDLKTLLKDKGINAKGKRAELEQIVLANLTLNDMEDKIFPKYDEKLKRHRQQRLREKYEYMTSFIILRSYFLRKITQHNDTLANQFSPRLSFGFNEQQEKLIAKALDGTGFDNVIVNGKVCKLLPLYMGSHASLMYDYQRR